MVKELNLRDKLAMERTIQANERTFLAYIRTSLASFIAGLGIIEFFDTYNLSLYLGFLAIGVGFVFLFLGIRQYSLRKRKLKGY